MRRLVCFALALIVAVGWHPAIATASPPQQLGVGDVLKALGVQREPTDYVMLVDVSLSMADGGKYERAKQALTAMTKARVLVAWQVSRRPRLTGSLEVTDGERTLGEVLLDDRTSSLQSLFPICCQGKGSATGFTTGGGSGTLDGPVLLPRCGPGSGSWRSRSWPQPGCT